MLHCISTLLSSIFPQFISLLMTFHQNIKKFLKWSHLRWERFLSLHKSFLQFLSIIYRLSHWINTFVISAFSYCICSFLIWNKTMKNFFKCYFIQDMNYFFFLWYLWGINCSFIHCINNLPSSIFPQCISLLMTFYQNIKKILK